MKFNVVNISALRMPFVLLILVIILGCCASDAPADSESAIAIATETASESESPSVSVSSASSPPVAANAIDDEIVCPSEQDDNSFVVQFPSPSDCSVFYKCNRGVPYKITCPDGLHYNARIQACDFPIRAKCPLINVI